MLLWPRASKMCKMAQKMIIFACPPSVLTEVNHERDLESAGFALGLCAGCSNRPVKPLMRTRRRRRATGRGTKRGICQARRWPVAPRAGAAGTQPNSSNAAHGRSCAIRLAVRLIRGSAPKGAKMFAASDMTSRCEAQSSRLVPSRTTRHLQRASRCGQISRTGANTTNGVV